MPSRGRPRVYAAALAAMLPACETLRPGPELDARWIGRDTGHLAASAQAFWCEGVRRLEIRGVHGDTGVGLVLYAGGESGGALVPGPYPVFDPLPDTGPPRPGSAVALRFFTRTLIKGYRGDSGSVGLARSGRGWRARVAARLLTVGGADTVWLTGVARGIVPREAPALCPDSVPPPDAVRAAPSRE